MQQVNFKYKINEDCKLLFDKCVLHYIILQIELKVTFLENKESGGYHFINISGS